MKRITFFLVIFFLSCINANSQWTVHTTSLSPSDMNAIEVIDTGTIYVATTFYLLKSDNGGASFGSSLYGPMNFDDVDFVDMNTGFTVCRVPNYTFFYSTSDAGVNWNLVGALPLLSIYELSFINASTGFASTLGGVYKTTNGGVNWVNTFVELINLTGIQFTGNNTLWVTSDVGLAQKSTDEGTSWLGAVVSQGVTMNGLHFLNSNTGWLASDNGNVYKTTTGWAPFTVSQVGLANCRLNSVYFADELTGYAAGCGGSIHKSTDGGSTWLQQTSGLTTTVFDIKFANPLTGWAAGAGGRILRTTNGGVIAITPISTTVPERFSLSQNYPNPFNPSTELNFQVMEESFIKIIIYDSRGREITALVNGNLKPGTYKADWNAAGYPSGIYFYRMTAALKVKKNSLSGFNETRKMILVK